MQKSPAAAVVLVCVAALLAAGVAVVGTVSRQPSASRVGPLPADVSAAPTVAERETSQQEGESSVYVDLAAAARANRRAEAEIRQSLQKKASLAFENEPLESAVQTIAKLAGVNIVLDRSSLAGEGIAFDAPVTGTYEDVALERICDDILERLELAWVVQNEVLLILAAVDADELREVRVYPAAALLKAGIDLAALKELLMEHTAGPWEERDGNGGRIFSEKDLLMIDQTQRVHRQIERLWERLEAAVQSELKHGAIPLWPSDDIQVYRRMFQRVDVDFDETPLQQAMAELSEKTGLRILINRAALAEESISPDEPVTLRVKGVTLDSALRLILDPFHMVPLVEEGVVKVTTDLDASTKWRTVVFNTHDLADRGYNGQEFLNVVLSVSPWLVSEEGYYANQPLPGLLIARSPADVHPRLALLLDDMLAASRRN